jgi:phosphate transport system substrate-binding protein
MYRTLCAAALALPLLAFQAPEKRLYVEPFATKSGSEALRGELISELRKLSGVSIVASAEGADETLGGGGEVWIKGYRSLNPRSGPSPSHGSPVYGGYLSVELKDRSGATLWSDLVTPSGDGDISKDLAKRIAKHLAAAVVHPAEPASALPQPELRLKGAGATFPYPVYAKWFANYRLAKIDYDAVGSEAGVKKLLAGEVDFGASDSPDAVRELGGDPAKYVLFPTVVGAVVPIVNLPGVTGTIQFTPQALAGIYLGKIKKWNDPVLKQANRQVNLPDLDIVVVHRADGSGTSYTFSEFLSAGSAEWTGSGLAPKWPVGRAAAGNDGVAKLVKEFGGAIGYVEYIYALNNHLSFGKVRNAHGEFVEASLESIAAAVRSAPGASLTGAPGAGAYPIASFTWLVVPAHIADAAKRAGIEAFLRWMIGPGQAQAAALGYLELPKEVIRRAEASIASLKD